MHKKEHKTKNKTGRVGENITDLIEGVEFMFGNENGRRLFCRYQYNSFNDQKIVK